MVWFPGGQATKVSISRENLVPISAALRLEAAMGEVLGRVLGELNELEGFSFQIPLC